MGEINYIRHQQINKSKWDECIEKSTNSLIYARSFYLDIMQSCWNALVFDDYKAVMPLTWRKKYGIYYLYQPPFTASLGVFGVDITDKLFLQFLNAIPDEFKYADIYLNHQNLTPAKGCYMRSNYVLDLNNDYAALYDNYRKNLKRNLVHADKMGCTFSKQATLSELLQLARLYNPSVRSMMNNEFQLLAQLYEKLSSLNLAEIFAVYATNGQLLSAALFVKDKNRLYYILPANHPNSKVLGASHFLIDRVIQLYASQPILLDFEGSDIKSLAFYYSSFGASHQPYGALKYNHLPFFLRWFKK